MTQNNQTITQNNQIHAISVKIRTDKGYELTLHTFSADDSGFNYLVEWFVGNKGIVFLTPPMIERAIQKIMNPQQDSLLRYQEQLNFLTSDKFATIVQAFQLWDDNFRQIMLNHHQLEQQELLRWEEILTYLDQLYTLALSIEKNESPGGVGVELIAVKRG